MEPNVKHEPLPKKIVIFKVIGTIVIITLLAINLYTTTRNIDEREAFEDQKKVESIEKPYKKRMEVLTAKIDSLLIENRLDKKEKETIIRTYEIQYKEIDNDTSHVQAIIKLLSRHSERPLQRN